LLARVTDKVTGYGVYRSSIILLVTGVVLTFTLHFIGALVTHPTTNDTVAKMHRQPSSGSSRDGAVESLNNDVCVGITAPSSTQISLDTLFKGASRHNDNTNEMKLLRFHLLLLRVLCENLCRTVRRGDYEVEY